MAAAEVVGDQRPRGVVAVGGSAGGVEALKRFASGLPEALPYAILVVLHMAPGTPSVLANIIDRSGPVPAEQARDGQQLQPGRIYVAVPDRHLLVDGHRIVVSRGPSEDSHRPSINALMRSAAVAYGPRAIGILLSGVLNDGVVGLAAIHARGGVAVVQHPDDALFPAMPINALASVPVRHQVAAAAAGQLLAQLAEAQKTRAPMQVDPNMEMENRIAMGARYGGGFDAEALGPRSGYTCPDCKGSLTSVGEKNYRCRIGHAWTADNLPMVWHGETETALSIAMRSLQEKVHVSRSHADSLGRGALQRRYAEIADEAEHAIAVLRERLAELAPRTEKPPDEPT